MIMKKEEYLALYKEEKLAETCEQLDTELEDLKEKYNRLLKANSDLVSKNNELTKLECLFKDAKKLHEKLETVNAEVYITLHHYMKNKIEGGHNLTNIWHGVSDYAISTTPTSVHGSLL